MIVDTAPFQQTIGNVIVGDHRTGALYNFYTSIQYTDATGSAIEFARFEVVRSTDGGAPGARRRWWPPTPASTRQPEHRPAPAYRVRLPFPAIDPRTGELYMAYEGSDFTGGSTTRSNSCTAPTAAAPGAPGTGQRRPVRPGVHPVHRGHQRRRRRGHLLRPAHPAPRQHHHAADQHLADHLPTRRPALRPRRQIAPVFDHNVAPDAGGLFLGDYQGLATFDDRFRALFVTTNARQPNNRTDVHFGQFRSIEVDRRVTAAAPAGPRVAAPAAPPAAALLRPLRRR